MRAVLLAGLVAAVCRGAAAVDDRSERAEDARRPREPLLKRGRLGAGRLGSSACAGRWLSPPELMQETAKPDGGVFQVWRFPLRFSNYSIFWRRFGVDIPGDVKASCPAEGCPILIDFPGAYGSVFTQRAWTQWHRYQESGAKFILVTAEGSPDAVGGPTDAVLRGEMDFPDEVNTRLVESSITTWNVLGWGEPTPPASADSCGPMPGTGPGTPACFAPALELDTAYECYASQLAKDPRTCPRWVAEQNRRGPSVKGRCASTTAANDWDYMKLMLEFLVDRPECRSGGWCGDRRRIYFSGQSMGGMVSLQFATPDPESIYYLGDTCIGNLRPAAVVACSPGGSRSSALDLRGEVPTLVMQGSGDLVAPPVVGAGLVRVRHAVVGGETKFVQAYMTEEWKRLLGESGPGGVMRRAHDYLLPGQPLPRRHRDRTAVLLQADAQQGGALLEGRLPASWGAGCPDRMAQPMGIGGDFYMWETLNTTVHRVTGVGKGLRMSTLTYTTTSGPVAEEIMFQCADAGAAAGSSKEIRVCLFKGGHTFPFLEQRPELLHAYVWEHFLRGGALA